VNLVSRICRLSRALVGFVRVRDSLGLAVHGVVIVLVNFLML
jgi:hypothetical protein